MAKITIDQVPGYAQQVWGGWVWMTDSGTEHHWSKSGTQEECERQVIAACQRLGIDGALDLLDEEG